MSQLAYARALHLLEDNGIDPTTARYILKRLADYGYTARERDPSPPIGGTPHDHTPGGAPVAVHPAKAARQERRASHIAQMRAQVDAARKAKADELAAALAAEQERRSAEDAARERALRVAEVLASMP